MWISASFDAPGVKWSAHATRPVDADVSINVRTTDDGGRDHVGGCGDGCEFASSGGSAGSSYGLWFALSRRVRPMGWRASLL